MKPVNILHVISRLPVGGVEKLILGVIRNYDRRRFRPCVCSLSDRGEIGAEIEKAGVEVICLGRLGHRFSPAMVMEIRDIIREKDISVVRTDQYHANLYGRLGAYLAGAPCVVATVHNVYTRDKKLHRRLINRALSRATDRVVAVSEAVKRDVVRYDSVPEEKVSVIYNGIETGLYPGLGRSTARAGLGIDPGAPVAGVVGRLVAQKGHRYLIKAVSEVKERLPGLVLLIVGDGPLKAELQGYAASLGLTGPDVIFTGARMDVPELLSAMDVFVFPSLWEGLGNALIEAMAARLPIIASDIAPVREVMPSAGIGALVPPGDHKAIAAKLELILKDRALASSLGRNAMERAAGFSIEACTAAYMRLYDDILKGKVLRTADRVRAL
jgi:glycosyltransferase involved in cell wall biosynthesis